MYTYIIHISPIHILRVTGTGIDDNKDHWNTLEDLHDTVSQGDLVATFQASWQLLHWVRRFFRNFISKEVAHRRGIKIMIYQKNKETIKPRSWVFVFRKVHGHTPPKLFNRKSSHLFWMFFFSEKPPGELRKSTQVALDVSTGRLGATVCQPVGMMESSSFIILWFLLSKWDKIGSFLASVEFYISEICWDFGVFIGKHSLFWNHWNITSFNSSQDSSHPSLYRVLPGFLLTFFTFHHAVHMLHLASGFHSASNLWIRGFGACDHNVLKEMSVGILHQTWYLTGSTRKTAATTFSFLGGH